MEIRRAEAADAADLAALLWRSATETTAPTRSKPAFAQDLSRWWSSHEESHVPYLAVLPSRAAVGMAWLAVLPRVPRPDSMNRLCGDIQSVYVLAEHRARGIGTALIGAALDHADALGLEHVTVHSGRRAVSLYERHGFGHSRTLLLRPPDEW